MITAVAAATGGVFLDVKVFNAHGGTDPAAAALAAIPRSHTAVLLEQERRRQRLISAAYRTLSVAGTPKLGSAPRLATRSSPPSSGSGGGTTTVLPAPPPNPGTAQSIAYNMMSSFGFSPSTQFSCLDNIWSRESGWRYNAENASGAYGIPQALPGSKMASAGADWQTNPATQIRWGLGYIQSTYGTPCNAWAFWEAHGWY